MVGFVSRVVFILWLSVGGLVDGRNLVGRGVLLIWRGVGIIVDIIFHRVVGFCSLVDKTFFTLHTTGNERVKGKAMIFCNS